jgi:hypothetical protein
MTPVPFSSPPFLHAEPTMTSAILRAANEPLLDLVLSVRRATTSPTPQAP